MNLFDAAAGRLAQSFQDSVQIGDSFCDDLSDTDMARVLGDGGFAIGDELIFVEHSMLPSSNRTLCLIRRRVPRHHNRRARSPLLL